MLGPLIVELQTLLHVHSICQWFISYNHQTEGYRNFGMAATTLFHILQKYHLNESLIFFQVLLLFIT
jgi:hypothetical protein